MASTPGGVDHGMHEVRRAARLRDVKPCDDTRRDLRLPAIKVHHRYATHDRTQHEVEAGDVTGRKWIEEWAVVRQERNFPFAADRVVRVLHAFWTCGRAGRI